MLLSAVAKILYLINLIVYTGIIFFFEFKRGHPEGPQTLEYLPSPSMPLDFKDFYDPIFTLADTTTSSRPLIVVTDHDGRGDVYVWAWTSSDEENATIRNRVLSPTSLGSQSVRVLDNHISF